MSFDPQKAGDWGTLGGFVLATITAFVGLITWPYKTFLTKKAAETTYLRKHTDTIDGVQYPGADTMYVSMKDWEEDIKPKIVGLLEQNHGLADVCREWMKKP